VGNRQELVDQLQASQRITADRAQTLAAERKKAADVAEKAKAKKASAEAAQRELESVQSQVKGRLATLVAEKQAAEERAREARARAAAAAAQRQAAAEQRAAAAAAAAPVQTAPAQPQSTQSSAPAQSVAPPPPAPTAPVPSSGRGAAALAAAAGQLGTPYVWGGSSPGGFDCSGLTMWAWAQAGVSIPRVTYSQRSAGRVVPISQLQPGDLVFYNGFSHVAMYAGGGSVIHAPHTGDVVRYASLYMSTPILAVRPG
jgi:cell wall-associated NlpC family hydrolase